MEWIMATVRGLAIMPCLMHFPGGSGKVTQPMTLMTKRVGLSSATFRPLRSEQGLQVNIMNPLLERITVNPEICGGRPCIKGTRIWVSLILDFLAEGMSEAELRVEYPQLVHEDVLAAIAYGAEAARERIVPIGISAA
jgi:uncharacterized protein (DUF433 family)